MLWYSTGARRKEARRSAEVDRSVARNRRTSAELLILIEQVRGQVAALDQQIEQYLERGRARA